MNVYLWIGAGSALGGVSRYFLANLIAKRLGDEFPYGTILVNITGSLLIGIITARLNLEENPIPTFPWRYFLVVGFCGGYTTFSSFSLETLHLLRTDQWLAAILNMLISVLLCLTAVGAGYVIGQNTR